MKSFLDDLLCDSTADYNLFSALADLKRVLDNCLL